MRSLSSIFFLVVYVIAMVHPAAPYIEYEVNKAYIAANLCENLDQPELQCNGSCHLKKQIRKQAEEKEDPAQVLIDADKFPVSTAPVGTPGLQVPQPQTVFPPYSSLLTSRSLSEVFHPPIV